MNEIELEHMDAVEALARQLADICIARLVKTDHDDITADVVARALFWAEHYVSEKNGQVADILARLHGEMMEDD